MKTATLKAAVDRVNRHFQVKRVDGDWVMVPHGMPSRGSAARRKLRRAIGLGIRQNAPAVQRTQVSAGLL